MARHAVAAEDKEARRHVILAAARTLFTAGDGTLPAASDIAAASGLAKGTLYLYFRTKEEIFLALLLELCRDVLDEIERAFRGTEGRRGDKVAAFIAAYVDHIERHPELPRLDGMFSSVLDKNLAPAALLAFKAAFARRLAETGTAIEGALRLPAGRGVRLLMRSFALTRGLGQAGSATDSQAAGSQAAGSQAADSQAAGTADLALLHPPFAAELAEALAEYWRGALSS